MSEDRDLLTQIEAGLRGAGEHLVLHGEECAVIVAELNRLRERLAAKTEVVAAWCAASGRIFTRLTGEPCVVAIPEEIERVVGDAIKAIVVADKNGFERGRAELDAKVRAAYANAREKGISAFLSVLAGGCSTHVVVENHLKLRDTLGALAGIPRQPDGESKT